jgi:hypothetical protein
MAAIQSALNEYSASSPFALCEIERPRAQAHGSRLFLLSYLRQRKRQWRESMFALALATAFFSLWLAALR